ncbi:MAG: hypothetical protein PHQ59_01195 [Candidatus Daviesbacteria bacterium]|nr:hypothetical protein [Candidatus Daviesbacteria bacterium]
MIKERVMEISEGLRSNGNLADLTPAEATAWSLQTIYCGLANKFEAQGKTKEAMIAHRRARMFYGNNPDFSSACYKIAVYIVKSFS